MPNLGICFENPFLKENCVNLIQIRFVKTLLVELCCAKWIICLIPIS